MAQWVEHLPLMREALGLIPSSAQTGCGGTRLLSHRDPSIWDVEGQKLQNILDYTASLGLAWATRDPVYKEESL